LTATLFSGGFGIEAFQCFSGPERNYSPILPIFTFSLGLESIPISYPLFPAFNHPSHPIGHPPPLDPPNTLFLAFALHPAPKTQNQAPNTHKPILPILLSACDLKLEAAPLFCFQLVACNLKLEAIFHLLRDFFHAHKKSLLFY
jgi:hypothetical protein